MTEDEILEHLLLVGQPPYAAHVWDYYWWTANAFVTSQRRSVHSPLVSQRCRIVMCALAAFESDCALKFVNEIKISRALESAVFGCCVPVDAECFGDGIGCLACRDSLSDLLP